MVFRSAVSLVVHRRFLLTQRTAGYLSSFDMSAWRLHNDLHINPETAGCKQFCAPASLADLRAAIQGCSSVALLSSLRSKETGIRGLNGRILDPCTMKSEQTR